MKEDPTYPARFEEVRIRAARTLEDEAVRRAKDGTAKPVLCKGKQVYVDGEPLYEHQYSDALMMFLLRAYDREKFGDRQLIELKLQDWDGDLSKLTDESVKRLLAGIEAKLAVEEARENALALPSWSSDRREEREGTGMSTAHANCSLPHLLFAGEWDGDLTKLTDKPQRRLLSQIKAKIAAEEAKLAPLVAPGATVIDATSEQPNPTPLNGNVRQLPWEVQSAVVTVGTVASQAVNFTVNP